MKIAAVIVTHNRLEMLIKCVEALRNQTYKLDNIIVVNNNSTDGTKEWLELQEGLNVINQENLGGAGGFNRGIKKAYEKGCDWIWTLDDDALTLENTLSKLVEKIQRKENIGILCSVILNKDNSVQEHSVPEFKHRSKILNDLVFEKDLISIRQSSFLSVLFNRVAIKKYGLPIKEMFIYYDDVEYTSRILKEDKFCGYLVLDSICFHLTENNFEKRFSKITDITRILLRNYFFVLKKITKSKIEYLSEIFISYYRTIKRFNVSNSLIKSFFTVTFCLLRAIIWNPKIEKIS